MRDASTQRHIPWYWSEISADELRENEKRRRNRFRVAQPPSSVRRLRATDRLASMQRGWASATTSGPKRATKIGLTLVIECSQGIHGLHRWVAGRVEVSPQCYNPGSRQIDHLVRTLHQSAKLFLPLMMLVFSGSDCSSPEAVRPRPQGPDFMTYGLVPQ